MTAIEEGGSIPVEEAIVIDDVSGIGFGAIGGEPVLVLEGFGSDGVTRLAFKSGPAAEIVDAAERLMEWFRDQ